MVTKTKNRLLHVRLDKKTFLGIETFWSYIPVCSSYLQWWLISLIHTELYTSSYTKISWQNKVCILHWERCLHISMLILCVMKYPSTITRCTLYHAYDILSEWYTIKPSRLLCFFMVCYWLRGYEHEHRVILALRQYHFWIEFHTCV